MKRCTECLHYEACKDWSIDCFGAATSFPYEADEPPCEYYKPTADVVEVVRCKDCKHQNPFGFKCLRDNLWHSSDDFCSYGERKEKSKDGSI